MRLTIKQFLPENEQGKDEERHGKYAEGDEAALHALRAEPHEQQNGETEDDGRDGLQDKVVGGGGLELGVYFAKQNHTVAGGAGKHAEHGEEAFLSIVGIEMLGTSPYIEERCHGTK